MPDSAIVEGPAVIPREFSLEQNYPNPFNPTTEFRYALPYPSNVRLTIYNVLGQPIRILVDGNQNAGYQSAEWNAGSYASGTYFYRLDAVSVDDPSKHFMQVRRMVLVK